MIQDSQSLPIEVCTRWRGASFSVAHRGGQQRGMEEEEEEDGRGYLVSRIIKAGDPLGFVYVVEGPGERGMWRKERKERRKRGGERGRGRGNGGREENREIKVGEEGERGRKGKKIMKNSETGMEREGDTMENRLEWRGRRRGR